MWYLLDIPNGVLATWIAFNPSVALPPHYETKTVVYPVKMVLKYVGVTHTAMGEPELILRPHFYPAEPKDWERGPGSVLDWKVGPNGWSGELTTVLFPQLPLNTVIKNRAGMFNEGWQVQVIVEEGHRCWDISIAGEFVATIYRDGSVVRKGETGAPCRFNRVSP